MPLAVTFIARSSLSERPLIPGRSCDRRRAPDEVAEVAVDGRVLGELGVERRDQHAPLSRHHCLPAVLGEWLDAGAEPTDARRPDEKHRDRHAPALEDGGARRLERLALTPRGVALAGDADGAP